MGPRGFRFLSPKAPAIRATSLMMFWSFSSSMKWVAPSNKLSWKNALFLFLCRDVKKRRNHLCFSLMQPHTIFNMKMQCNVFLPHVLLTRRQFQRLKYSVCPSVYTDNLIFTRKINSLLRLVVYTVELIVSEWVFVSYKCGNLSSIHEESLLRVFRHLNSLEVRSLGVGFWCFNISWLLS